MWPRSREVITAGMVGLLGVAMAAQRSPLNTKALVAALQRGGCVVVMRHTSSPVEPPTKARADPENPALERQLDEKGRTDAIAMGAAMHRLGIAIGEVWTSPTYRARETARLTQLSPIQVDDHLGDRGQSMRATTDAQAAWLQTRVTVRPTKANTVVITHQPNIAHAFPEASDVADGECLIFRPDGQGGTVLLGRLRIGDWPLMK